MKHPVRLAALAACLVAALALPATAGASWKLQLGIMDDGYLHADASSGGKPPEAALTDVATLKPDVLRVLLWWKDVAPTRPLDPRDPASYGDGWARYDALVRAVKGWSPETEILFSVLGTPSWANGGKRWQFKPKAYSDYENFVYAAALRYSGSYPAGSAWPLPEVTMWTAWNEPNLAAWLVFPRYKKMRQSKYETIQAAVYKRLCTVAQRAVAGVQPLSGATQKMACGVTAPTTYKRSVAPLKFLRLFRAAGGKTRIWAHNAHARSKRESPTTAPSDPDAITLGNINKLNREAVRRFGRKVRIWITEYGYQTNPPDPIGVSPYRQAKWMGKAFAVARDNKRIDLLTWFLIRDEPDQNGDRFGVGGWQSGLRFEAASPYGDKKRSYAKFQALAAKTP